MARVMHRDVTTRTRLPGVPEVLIAVALAALFATALWSMARTGAASTGALLAGGGVWAWLAATCISRFGPLPAGRRSGRAMNLLLAASAASMVAVVAGLGLLAAGGLG